jgi:hypothetical protein
MKRKIALVLLVFSILLGIRFLVILHSTPALDCVEKEHDFGPLPVADGKAVGRHVFTIRNNTPRALPIKVGASCFCLEVESSPGEIPANGTGSVAVRLTLERNDLSPRGAWLQIASEGHPPLKIGVKGRAGFSTYITPENLSLGDFHPNDFQPRETHVSVLSHHDATRGAPELKVRLEDAALFDLGTSNPKEIPVRNGAENAVLTERKIRLFPRRAITGKLGPGSSRLFVETADGFQREIPLSWNVSEKDVFDCGKRYYLTGFRPGGKLRFKIRHDGAVGGEFSKCDVRGGPVRILSEERDGDRTTITLEYSPDDTVPASAKIAELTVFSKDGRQHSTEILLSKESPAQ